MACGMNAQLLYKISGNGLKKPSYIIGTHHLCDVKFVDKVPGLKTVLAETEQVCGELVMSDMQNPDSLNMMKAMMMLPDGQTIKDVLTDDEMNRLNATLKSLIGADFTNPMLMAQMGNLTPSTLETQLSLLLYLMHHQGEFDPQNPFDGYFQQQAIASGKPVIAFETVAFQSEVLFKNRTMERSKQLLMCLCDNLEYNSTMLETLTMAYLKQDLKAMEELSNEKLNNQCDETPEEENISINNRNDNWVKMMPKQMAEKSTFYAVGALHLCGDHSVLKQLQKAGYTVTPVTE